MPSLNVPVTLSNGSIADANQVMQNFDAIETYSNTYLVDTAGTVKATSASITDGAVITSKINDAAVTASKLEWSLPRGVVARTSVTSTSAFVSAQTPVFPVVNFTATANRIYMVFASAYFDADDPNDDSILFANLVNSAGVSGQNLLAITNVFGMEDLYRQRVTTNYLYIPAITGTESFNINMGRFSGTGSIRLLAAADNPSQLTVVDMGGVV